MMHMQCKGMYQMRQRSHFQIAGNNELMMAESGTQGGVLDLVFIE